MKQMILLLDKNRKPVGPVENALSLSVETKLNELGTAQLTMAAADPQHGEITVPASWAHIWDGADDLGLWRFSAAPDDAHAPGGKTKYSLQSGECTLLDDMLTGDHEIGGTGYSTRQVLQYILDRQTTKLWSLGTCEFEDYYQYHFSDVTLLEALLSIGECLLVPYQFTFDTLTWTVSLMKIGEAPACTLAYNRQMTSVSRSVDGRIVNRLYGRGYGEGDNQLTIKSVNAGKDYLDNAQSIAKYGVRCGVHVDTRQQDPATLKAHMQAIVESSGEPGISYEVSAIDLWRETGEEWDRVRAGDRVLVLDQDLGPVTAIVTGKKKSDILGDAGNVSYTLDTNRIDTAEELNDLREKIGIHELYSQGATNMYSMQVMDNCDEAKPLTLRFYIPKNVLRINSCLLTWRMERFRTYTKQVASGGASTRTSSESGGATVTTPATTTEMNLWSGYPRKDETSGMDATDMSADDLKTGSVSAHSHDMSHTHSVSSHTHSFSGSYSLSWGHQHTLVDSDSVTGGVKNYAAKTISISGTTGGTTLSTSGPRSDGDSISKTGTAGGHSHSVPKHNHGMKHFHIVQGSVKIPSMSFQLSGHSHSVQLPDHTHELEYGVYEASGSADSLQVKVDGTEIPAGETEDAGRRGELDVAKYLKADSEGKATRGAWHTVDFVPSGISRVTADLFFQVFIQSRGAGDY